MLTNYVSRCEYVVAHGMKAVQINLWHLNFGV